MKAVRFDHADPSFPASVCSVPEPALPNGEWARVRVTGCGICGSDLHLFGHNRNAAPLMAGWVVFPWILGHELAGTVIEAGPDCPVPVGSRVAVDPKIPCRARGIDPVCDQCASGHLVTCRNLTSKVLTGGTAIGFTDNLGGGWAEQALAHHTMLHPLPDGVDDRVAPLHEPLSIAAHGVLRHTPEEGVPCAVVGAGVIGLAVVAALKHLLPSSPVTVVAKHAHQAAAAEACGADHVVRVAAEGSPWEALAAIVGGSVVGGKGDWMLSGGFPYVVEAVGTSRAVSEALRMVERRGTVVQVGASGVGEVDLTPLWLKEAALLGGFDHSYDPGPGGRRHSIDRAIDILASGRFPADAIITHEFPLERIRDAVAAGLDRESGVIKVLVRPE